MGGYDLLNEHVESRVTDVLAKAQHDTFNKYPEMWEPEQKQSDISRLYLFGYREGLLAIGAVDESTAHHWETT